MAVFQHRGMGKGEEEKTEEVSRKARKGRKEGKEDKAARKWGMERTGTEDQKTRAARGKRGKRGDGRRHGGSNQDGDKAFCANTVKYTTVLMIVK